MQEERQLEQRADEGTSERAAHMALQERAMTTTWQQEQAHVLDAYAATLQEQMMQEVVPSLCKVLIDLARARPVDALSFLSRRLLEEADRLDTEHIDPYAAPLYAERRELVAAKLRRNSEREEARASKMEREAAARSAADAKLRTLLIQSVQKHQSMMRSAKDVDPS